MGKTIVVYKPSDFDSVCAAAAVSFGRDVNREDIMYVPHSPDIGRMFDLTLKGSDLVTIALPNVQQIDAWAKKAKSHVCYSPRHSDCIEINGSLCASVWKHFADGPVPALIRHLDDRVSNTYALGDSRSFIEGLAMEQRTPDRFAALMESSIDDLIAAGRVVVRYKQQHIDRYVSGQLVLKNLWGFKKVPVYNAPRFMVTEILTSAAQQYPIALSYHDHGPNRYWSVRGNGSFNVGALCKKLGGNGRDRSGGFTTKRNIFGDLHEVLTKMHGG